MVSNRIAVTIPAAGTFTEVKVAGHYVYVETTSGLSSDPSDIVTIHPGSASGDGIAALPKVEFVVCEGFKRLYIKGTSTDAGNTLSLLVVSDPCLDIGNVSPNPCGGAEATAALGTSYTLFFVWDSTNEKIMVTPKSSIAWVDFLDNDPATVDVRDMWADYQNHYLYWVTGTDGSTQTAACYRAKYDPTTGLISGSHETLVTEATNDIRGLAVDTATGRIYLSNKTSNRISWIPLAGGSETVLTGTFSNPNRMAFYLDPSTTLGVLHICLDGVGEIMAYDIDSETDLGTKIGPSGTDYDEISAHPAADFVMYRRDNNINVRFNDWGTYGAESVAHSGGGGSVGQLFVDRVDARAYFIDGVNDDIRSMSFMETDETDHGALPTASATQYPRFCLG